jgi:hypothetical protein
MLRYVLLYQSIFVFFTPPLFRIRNCSKSNSTFILRPQAHVYKSGSVCAAFLANIDDQSDKTVTFNGKAYKLPAWSVSILPDCKNVVLNTAQVCLSYILYMPCFLERTSPWT